MTSFQCFASLPSPHSPQDPCLCLLCTPSAWTTLSALPAFCLLAFTSFPPREIVSHRFLHQTQFTQQLSPPLAAGNYVPLWASVSLLVTFWDSGTDTVTGCATVTTIMPWRRIGGTRATFFPQLPRSLPGTRSCKPVRRRRL